MAHINELIAIAEADEAKVIYEMHKASCSCPVPTDCNCADEWDTSTLLNGGSAHAVLSGETLTITYINGVAVTHNGTGEIAINPAAEGPLADTTIPVGTV